MKWDFCGLLYLQQANDLPQNSAKASLQVFSLRGRRLKGKGKGVLGVRETRGAREEKGKEGNACQETIVFAIPPTNYVCKNNTTVND